jgi:hypothetical protein
MNSIVGDMVQHVESAEDHGEESAPLGVVVHLHVEGVWDKRLDGDVVEGLGHRGADSDAGGRRHGGWGATCCRRKGVTVR